jgi:phenylpropionate dioxygenase-like ring-hydroxylating dioxygenase large terminal subunit
MDKPFLKNAWYVAAWSDELGRALIERIIINEPIVLYRDSKNRAHAMDNTCPHRYAPLHQGKLVDDCITCPYHALRFNSEGKCVHNPNGNAIIPGKSDLRVYPITEMHEMLWVWMGDPTLADDTKIPDFSCHSDSELKMVKGTLDIEAYYELISDNLMDLTHATTVHEGVLGSEAIARGINTVLQDGTTVWSNSWCPDGMAPPAFDAAFDNYGKPVDLWTHMRWDAPAHMLLDVGVTPTGKPRADGLWVYGTDILTPISHGLTRYYWAIARTYRPDDPSQDALWQQSIKIAFEGQDKPMLEAQQRMLKIRGGIDIDEFDHAGINTDGGPVRVRHVLKKLIEQEGDGITPDPRNPDLKSLRNSAGRADSVEAVC